MKKLSLFVLGAALLFAPVVSAQEYPEAGIVIAKVNADKLRNDIAKSDAEIADAKKTIKSATWIKRGNTFVAVDARPVNGLFTGLTEALLKLSLPQATSTQEVINGRNYTVYDSGQARIFVLNGVVEAFLPAIVIDSAALDKAYDAFDYAYRMDPKAVKKVRKGMNEIRAKRVETGGFLYSLADYATAAENFTQAYKASIHPAVTQPDTVSFFNAGWSLAAGSDFAGALPVLDSVIAMGYHADGRSYYLKAYCQANLKDTEGAFSTLRAAISLYPTNEDIIELLLTLYADNEEDPGSLVEIVRSAIDKNPTNPNLYQGLARIYNKLKDWDNAIATIRKAVELEPDNFYSNYLEGDVIIAKGNAMQSEVDKQTFTSRDQSQKAKAEVDKVFAEALVPLEKAHSLNANELVIVELLKNLTFRLREDPEMSKKYDAYLALFNQMSAKK